MIALVGDAELDEGNIFEAMLEGWKQGLRNCWWIIDYNRQSLDAVVREGLWERYEQLFKNFGWDVVILKYGSLQQAAFREPGGERLRQWIDTCPNQLYSALVFQGGAAWRKRLRRRHRRPGRGDEADRDALRRGAGAADEQSRRPRPALADRSVRQDRPRPADLLHLLHREGLRPADRRPQGQSRRPDDAGADGSRARRDEHPARPRVGPVRRPRDAAGRIAGVPRPRAVRAAKASAASRRPGLRCRTCCRSRSSRTMSTQTGFGALLNELAREKTELASRIVTTSPDVTVSTNLGPWVNRRGLFARETHGRHVQERAHPLDVQLGVLAEGPAHRARHRRDEPVHPALGARPVALDQRRAAAADRHAVRPVHRARPRCAQLRLLPGRALHPGGDAVRHHARARGRRAPVDRPAADRHGAGRARRVRAGLRRRACRDHGVRARLHPEGRRRRGLRAQLAARRDRRLGLSAPLDAPGRADQARDDERSCARASSTAPIGCASPGRTARWSSPIPARSRPRRSRRSA